MDLGRYRAVIPEWSRFLEAASRAEPTVFRVRTGRITPDALADRMRAQGYRLRALEGMPAFFQVEEGPRPVSLTLEHWLGLIYVQQASTGVAAPALAPRPGERVLDLCAAPGGKTTHATDLMDDRGCVVAADVSEGRLRGLLGNVYRLGHTGVFVVSGDGRDFPDGALFDRVLVDAPCSGEGTLRRRGGRPPEQSASFMRYVTRAQAALLRRAVRLTRPGGTILYVTCTFAPEENEGVVSEVLADEPVELEPLSLPVPHAPGLTAFEGRRFDPRLEGAARIYPHHLDSGGLFLARLRRLDDGGTRGGRAASEADAGAWSRVPPVFPGDGMESAEAETLVARALEALDDHFGVGAGVFGGMGWTARGGRLWLHSLAQWPLEAWEPGRWRPLSVGFRAVEFDTRGRSRPTNDLLQWLGRVVVRGAVDLETSELVALLDGGAVERAEELYGLLALRWSGAVVGRGVATSAGVRSEVPRARAADLRSVITGKGSVTPTPDDD
ncbi:MAG: RsmB/NOP family class I SAM-dependent RNA methyltransferase [Gemmatimonadetes bacterium]|nr:RsmB/NOP family class I SAM-dependent RNA methyltransferase [Gemmatimonadota bacterium]